MGVIIYLSGSLVVSDHNGEGLPVDYAGKAAKEIAEMKGSWGSAIFVQDGYALDFRSEMIEGSDPIADYVEAPIKQAIEIAKANKAYIDGDIYIASDWGDYDNIHIEIRENQISMDNAEIANATDEELIAELAKRGYGVFNKKGTYRDVIKTILPITCEPYVSGIFESNQVDVGANDFFPIKAPKSWWDAQYGCFEEEGEDDE